MVMERIPIVASVSDLPAAIEHGERVPASRWYIMRRATILKAYEQIPQHWIDPNAMAASALVASANISEKFGSDEIFDSLRHELIDFVTGDLEMESLTASITDIAWAAHQSEVPLENDAMVVISAFTAAGQIDKSDCDEIVEAITAATRFVRTPAGAEHFGQPVGSVIDADVPIAKLPLDELIAQHTDGGAEATIEAIRKRKARLEKQRLFNERGLPRDQVLSVHPITAASVRHVRTAEGAEYYGQPIGSVIVPNVYLPLGSKAVRDLKVGDFIGKAGKGGEKRKVHSAPVENDDGTVSVDVVDEDGSTETVKMAGNTRWPVYKAAPKGAKAVLSYDETGGDTPDSNKAELAKRREREAKAAPQTPDLTVKPRFQSEEHEYKFLRNKGDRSPAENSRLSALEQSRAKSRSKKAEDLDQGDYIKRGDEVVRLERDPVNTASETHMRLVDENGNSAPWIVKRDQVMDVYDDHGWKTDKKPVPAPASSIRITDDTFATQDEVADATAARNRQKRADARLLSEIEGSSLEDLKALLDDVRDRDDPDENLQQTLIDEINKREGYVTKTDDETAAVAKADIAAETSPAARVKASKAAAEAQRIKANSLPSGTGPDGARSVEFKKYSAMLADHKALVDEISDAGQGNLIPDDGNTIRVRTKAQKILLEEELQGQISDGMWENSSPDWEDWSGADVIVDPENVGRNWYARKDNYQLNSKNLLDIVGDRMVDAVKEGDGNPSYDMNQMREDLGDLRKIFKTKRPTHTEADVAEIVERDKPAPTIDDYNDLVGQKNKLFNAKQTDTDEFKEISARVDQLRKDLGLSTGAPAGSILPSGESNPDWKPNQMRARIAAKKTAAPRPSTPPAQQNFIDDRSTSIGTIKPDAKGNDPERFTPKVSFADGTTPASGQRVRDKKGRLGTVEETYQAYTAVRWDDTGKTQTVKNDRLNTTGATGPVATDGTAAGKAGESTKKVVDNSPTTDTGGAATQPDTRKAIPKWATLPPKDDADLRYSAQMIEAEELHNYTVKDLLQTRDIGLAEIEAEEQASMESGDSWAPSVTAKEPSYTEVSVPTDVARYVLGLPKRVPIADNTAGSQRSSAQLIASGVTGKELRDALRLENPTWTNSQVYAVANSMSKKAGLTASGAEPTELEIMRARTALRQFTRKIGLA